MGPSMAKNANTATVSRVPNRMSLSTLPSARYRHEIRANDTVCPLMQLLVQVHPNCMQHGMQHRLPAEHVTVFAAFSLAWRDPASNLIRAGARLYRSLLHWDFLRLGVRSL